MIDLTKNPDRNRGPSGQFRWSLIANARTSRQHAWISGIDGIIYSLKFDFTACLGKSWFMGGVYLFLWDYAL